MISLPDRLNTRRSLRCLPSSDGVQQRLPSLLDRPIAFAHRGARAHAPENTIEAFALAPAARRDRSGERRLADRRRRAGARPRRRRAASAGASGRSATLAAPSCPRTSRRWPSCSTRAGPTTTCRSTSRTPTPARRSSTSSREPRPELLPRLWLCHPDVDALARAAPVDDDVRLVDSTRLDADQGGARAPGGDARRRAASTPSTSTTPTGTAA